MDDRVFSSEIPLGGPSDTGMDLDFVDELLLGGCWLETTEGSVDLFKHSPSISGAFFDSTPYSVPMLDSSNSKSQTTQSYHELEAQKTYLHDDSSAVEHDHSQSGGSLAVVHRPSSIIQSSVNCTFPGSNNNSLDSLLNEGSELNRLFWIQPQTCPGLASSSVMHRLVRALGFITELTRNRDVLVQIWVPVSNSEGARVLTTSDQPFIVDPSSSKLAHYRNISVNYQFAAEEDSVSRVRLGLPGRVYVGKVPEWTPDVRFFRADEYPRVNDAQMCDVRGTLAVPVFDQGSRECLGVIELVMTMQKANYRGELDSVCRALQAVDLRSTELPSSPHVKEVEFHNSYHVVVPEILEVMKSACETHGLPLAQTWVPCIQQGKQGCRHSDDNLLHCVSTVDSACYVADIGTRTFHDTCSEHHLLKGQGVAGRAFLTNQPCFSPDITTCGKTEYPLSHHARMFGLCAAVAIRLRSVYTGNCDFVLEFFLPAGCRDPEGQKSMLNSLSTIIQQVCKSLRVVTEEELSKETTSSTTSTVINNTVIKAESAFSPSSSKDELAGSSMRQQQYGSSSVQWCQEDKSRAMAPELKQEAHSPTLTPPLMPSSIRPDNVDAEGSLSTLVNSGQKKRAKSDKTITLDVLRQHFAGSLKDAAKNLGVCPTTLKRICRQYGIKRWPSRKIKKVGHSLQKLQVVIDSVQGASGAFQIGSFYSNFPQLASPSTNVTGSDPVSASKPYDPPKPTSFEPTEGGNHNNFAPQGSKSPSSSFSHSSSSSQCLSSGSQQHLATCSTSFSEDILTGAENSSESNLKRARSDAELHILTQEANNLLMSRCQSHKILPSTQHQNVESHPPLPKFAGQAVQLDSNAWRVKVTYGEEKIRLRMAKSWGYKELVQEVVRRFNIGDMSGFHLKYLDDDSEWVLLTCDDDLEECIDVCGSSQQQTLRLALQVSHCNSRSYVGSNSL
ncbi:hypothetical protein V2J09_023969 [Rumex salicifolius]